MAHHAGCVGYCLERPEPGRGRRSPVETRRICAEHHSGDIRAGAGLVLAGLVSEGITTVEDAFHVDRGYPGFVEALLSLGAKVSRHI